MGSTALSPAARRWRRSWTWCSDWRTATAASLYSTRPATGKELIGHERGAFTGAFTRKTGLFEAAQGGTVFLDEIAILSVDFQGKLLRVIQERQLRRVGGTEILDIDMRLLSATNEDLDKAMVEGRFRQDLFYRLNVLTITLPALRERDGHVPLLAEHFVKELNQRASRKVDGIFPEAMQVLRRYEWPGNVRELQNAIEGAFSLTSVRHRSAGGVWHYPERRRRYDPWRLHGIDSSATICPVYCRRHRAMSRMQQPVPDCTGLPFSAFLGNTTFNLRISETGRVGDPGAAFRRHDALPMQKCITI